MIPAASSSLVRKTPNPLFNVTGKCFVSGCPNRMGSLNRGTLNGTPKRFFSFPTAPDRVKVWLAALRETDRDPSEQQLICEDHFLSEDISESEVSSDAIPIMPPYLDGPSCPVGPWSADPFQEEEQWSGVGWDNEEEDEEASEPQQQDPKRAAEDPSEPDVTSDFCPEKEPADWSIREGTPLTRLTRGFLELLMSDPDASVEVGEAARSLQTHTRRVHVVVEVLRGIGLVQRDSDNRVRWIGSSPIFSFLWRDTLTFLTALQRLKAVEEEVDRLFSSCAQQLLTLTEDEESSALAYVRCEDICRLGDLGQRTAIVIRSPPETKLVIPPPEEDGIRMLLKSENGPISAVACDVGPLTSEASSGGRFFSTLEGRVRVYTFNGAVRKRKI